MRVYPSEETVTRVKFEFWTSALREDQVLSWDVEEPWWKAVFTFSRLRIYPQFLATARISLNC